MPCRHITHDLFRTVGPSGGNGALLGIDHPILLDASVRVEILLLLPIASARVGGQDLYDENRDRRARPIVIVAARIGMRLPDHEVGLDLGALEPYHRTRMVHEAESMFDDVRRQDAGQLRVYRLVRIRRRRRHEQFSAHQLVLVAIVRQSMELRQRPFLGCGGHGHSTILLGGSPNAFTRRGWREASRDHHRIFSLGIIAAPRLRSAAEPSQYGERGWTLKRAEEAGSPPRASMAPRITSRDFSSAP